MSNPFNFSNLQSLISQPSLLRSLPISHTTLGRGRGRRGLFVELRLGDLVLFGVACRAAPVERGTEPR